MATANYTIHKQKDGGMTDWGVYLSDGTWANNQVNKNPAVFPDLESALNVITSFNTGTSVAYNVRVYYTSA